MLFLSYELLMAASMMAPIELPESAREYSNELYEQSQILKTYSFMYPHRRDEFLQTSEWASWATHCWQKALQMVEYQCTDFVLMSELRDLMGDVAFFNRTFPLPLIFNHN